MKKNLLPMLLLGLFGLTQNVSADNNHSEAASPAPEWLNNAVIYEVNLRQATPQRNLRAMQAELPRLKDLGVDVIWLMPIHPISEKNRKGGLGSYYAVKDYKAVNPQFGSIDDLKDFVSTAHTLDMKVILDEVCNHTGCDNSWILSHPGYYALNESGEMFGPFDWTDTYKLDYSNPDLREAMISNLEFWLINADIDGYRCDVAGEVPTDFWEEARPRLQAIKPVFMLAEAAKPELLNKSFDADYAWPMKDVFNAIAATQGINQWAIDHKENRPATNAHGIIAKMNELEKDYPHGAVHMNMITNHDLNSWEGTEFDRFGPGMEAFAVLSYTLPGIPMMYTGQEVGFNHSFEFFENDSVQPDYTPNEITRFYKTLNTLKHSSPALNANDADASFTFYPTKDENVICFERKNGDNRVLVFANLSAKNAKVKFTSSKPVAAGLNNLFHPQKKAAVPTSLAPWQYVVLH